jgi:hypothetical protein
MSLRRFVEPSLVTAPIAFLIAVAKALDMGAIVNATATACRQALLAAGATPPFASSRRFPTTSRWTPTLGRSATMTARTR